MNISLWTALGYVVGFLAGGAVLRAFWRKWCGEVKLAEEVASQIGEER